MKTALSFKLVTAAILSFTVLSYIESVASDATRTSAKFYSVNRNPKTWQEAWYQCRNTSNGILASIEQEFDDVKIHDLLLVNGIEKAWTSGLYMGAWMWGASGRLIGVEYSNWSPGYPGLTSNPLAVYSSGFNTYEWITEPSTVEMPFICESINNF